MFSFFKRSSSKKDPSDSCNTNKKHKDNSGSPARNPKEMCKNIQNVECAPQCANVSVTTEAQVAPNNVETVCVSGGEIETNTRNDETSENATMSVSSKAQGYASMLRSLDQPNKETNRGGRVKPCGHGTVAVAPKIPLQANKRDNAETPPDSPKAERNKLPFYKMQTEQLHNKNNSLPKYELVKTQPVNDTVTGVMKLRVDIPTTPPPNENAEKYVCYQRDALFWKHLTLVLIHCSRPRNLYLGKFFLINRMWANDLLREKKMICVSSGYYIS